MKIFGDTRLKELPEWFKNHPVTQQIISEEEEKTRKARAAARADFDRAVREEAIVVPQLEATLTDCSTELGFLEERKAEIIERFGKEAVRLRGECSQIKRNMQRAAGILLTTYNPAIDEAIDFFRGEMDRLRRTETSKTSRYLGPENAANYKREIAISTNQPAILEALDYCRKAIEELEKMKLFAECDHKRIEAIKDGLPSSDRITEYETYGHWV